MPIYKIFNLGLVSYGVNNKDRAKLPNELKEKNYSNVKNVLKFDLQIYHLLLYPGLTRPKEREISLFAV